MTVPENIRKSARRSTESTRLGIASAMLIVILGTLAYSNTFGSAFHLDDYENIVDNAAIRDIGDPGRIWDFNNRRFVGYLTFALNYRLHGLDVTGYHLVNLLVHIGASLCAWLLTLLIFSTPEMKKRDIGRYGGYAALGCGLLFAVHPLQTQAVTYIVQRFASLAALFYLASLCLYVKGRLSRGMVRRLSFSGSVIAAFLGLFTKENVFTLPFAVLLTEIYFFHGGPRKTLSFLLSKRRLPYLVPFVVFLAIMPLVADVRTMLHYWTAHSQRHLDPPMTVTVYLFTQFRVIVRYLRLLFLPFGQNVDHDVPASTSLFEPGVIPGLLVLAALAAAAVVLFRRYRVVSFGIAWFFLTLAVESSFKPLNNVMFEHRLYLPMFGFALSVTALFFHLPGGKNLKASAALFLAVVIACTVGTFRRNAVWKTDVSLWEDAARKSPRKPRTRMMLGRALDRAGDIEGARREYETALSLYRNYPEALVNLGTTYYREGGLERAKALFERALDITPSYDRAHLNLGTVLYREGSLDEAADHYRRALYYRPDLAEAESNLGLVMEAQGETEQAVAHFRTALSLRPDYVNAHLGLGGVLFRMGDIDGAVRSFRRALELNPDSFEAHRNLGAALARLSETDEAATHLQRALELNPDAGAHLGLADILRDRNDFRRAAGHYEAALALDPGSIEAHRGLARCAMQLGDPETAARHLEEAARIMRENTPQSRSENQ